MAIGYLYALLGLLSFGALGIFHKLADVRHCRPRAVSVLLYGWSLLFVTLIVAFVRQQPIVAPPVVVGIAIPFGIAASVAILALQSALPYGNIATSWLAINLSAAVPTVASILVYHEPISARKGLALALIVCSILLLWKDKTVVEQAAAERGRE